MLENACIDYVERVDGLTTDGGSLSQLLLELRKITAAAREVTYQRYNSDRDGTFVKEFPTVSLAIFQLAELVGTPTKRMHLSVETEARGQLVARN